MSMIIIIDDGIYRVPNLLVDIEHIVESITHHHIVVNHLKNHTMTKMKWTILSDIIRV